MRFLTLAEVLALHRQVVEQTRGSQAVRDLAGLTSAVAQPRMTFEGRDLEFHGLDWRLRCIYTVGMRDLRFEWDAAKDKQNRRKHGVSFAEAESIFADEFARLLDDPEHSTDEDRFVLLGLSARLRTLVVVHAYRGHEGVIRIISARKATRKERGIYNLRWKR